MYETNTSFWLLKYHPLLRKKHEDTSDSFEYPKTLLNLLKRGLSPFKQSNKAHTFFLLKKEEKRQIREEKRKLIVVPCVKLPATNSSEENSELYVSTTHNGKSRKEKKNADMRGKFSCYSIFNIYSIFNLAFCSSDFS